MVSKSSMYRIEPSVRINQLVDKVLDISKVELLGFGVCFGVLVCFPRRLVSPFASAHAMRGW